jgi:hypothetical protein
MADVPSRGSPTVRSRVAARGVDVVLVTVRELRLLLGLLLVLFVTSETWRYVGRLTTSRLVLFVLATLAGALLVVGLGVRRTVGRSAVRRATVRVAVEVLAFTAALFAAFTVIGVLSVDAGLVAEWSGSPDGVLVTLGVGSPPLVLTAPLLQVSGFLAALGGLSFAVEVISDADTRATIVRDLVDPDDGDPAPQQEPTPGRSHPADRSS